MAADSKPLAAADAGGGGRASAGPSRPTLVLPPRASYEAILRGGGGAMWDTSPGPMTLVASFFEPESECQSFSQLLAGAIASPAEATAQPQPLLASSPVFAVPPGLSPGGLLNSPGFFGRFGMTHQEALAQVTAQARSNAQFREYASTFSEPMTACASQPTDPVSNLEAAHKSPPQISDAENITLANSELSQLDDKTNLPVPSEKSSEDGYNWRKYGQKQVKSSEYPRSYYKCTHPNCLVKKKIERSLDGEIIEIVYKGQHNHQKPSRNKRGKQGSHVQTGSNGQSGKVVASPSSEIGSDALPKAQNRLNEVSPPCMLMRDQELNGASEQLSGSSEGEEAGETESRANGMDHSEPDAKRRKSNNNVTVANSHKTLTEPRIIVQTVSEVDLLDDGYRWRKYGQKVVKGNPNPRSYYKCTYMGCGVRKHIERAATDPKSVVTTYEGKHNHDLPSGKKGSHNAANNGSIDAVANSSIGTLSNQFLQNNPDLKNGGVNAITFSQLKEEQEIT